MLGCTGYTDCPQCKRLDAQCSLRAKAIVTSDPVEDALKVGDTFNFTVGLRDDSMSLPVQDVLTIRVVDEEKAHKKAKQKGQPGSGDKGSKKGEGPDTPTLGLPKFILLTKDGHPVGDQETQPWPPGFTELDGGTIDDFADKGTIYKINYDNAYHLKYRLSARGDIARDVITEKYILGGMRILMLGYEHALRALTKERQRPRGEWPCRIPRPFPPHGGSRCRLHRVGSGRKLAEDRR